MERLFASTRLDEGFSLCPLQLDRCHHGDEYVHDLYCCGVYDAIYLDEVSADRVMKLIKNGRNCAQSREYYGITTLRDAERQRNIADEEYLNAYLECVEEGRGTEDINSRYRFATTRLGSEENQILAGSITVSVAGELVGNELCLFYKGGNKEKRRWFRKWKPSVSQDIVSFPEEDGETGNGTGSRKNKENGYRDAGVRGKTGK